MKNTRPGPANHLRDNIHSAAAKGFQAGADAYERGRPEYPGDAVERLARELKIGPESVIVDLAAGTGKFTRILAKVVHAKIIAIEPVEEMQRKFSATLPLIEVLDGTAEKIPLPDSSVDAVTVAQAFHWFDGHKALKEIHRVLKPGGALGLIWNVRDESVEWVAKLTKIIEPYEGNAPRYKSGEWRKAFESTSLFTKLESAQFPFVHQGTIETILDRTASISFISALPESDKRKVLDEAREMLTTNAETTGKAQIEFPYRTNVFWCRPLE